MVLSLENNGKQLPTIHDVFISREQRLNNLKTYHDLVLKIFQDFLIPKQFMQARFANNRKKVLFLKQFISFHLIQKSTAFFI